MTYSGYITRLQVAMYSLIMFYKTFRHELQPMKPLPKFLCIKGVVFFSFL